MTNYKLLKLALSGCLAVALAMLGGCMGDNKKQVIAGCTLEYGKVVPIAPEQGRLIQLCIESHGYEVDRNKCSFIAPKTIEDCYTPGSLENKLRSFVE
jgi:hypothetical protein